MDWFHWTMLAMSAITIVGTPFLLASAIRRRQYHRLFEIPLAALVVCYIAFNDVWPSAVQNAPPLVHRLLLVLLVLWIMECLGFFRWLFSRHQRTQKI